MSKGVFPHPWSKMAQDYRRAKAQLPDQISHIALLDFKENFRRQGTRDDGGGTKAWAKRKRNKSKADATRAILTKSGRLKRSLRKKPLPGQARVITNVIYAQRHQEGDDDMKARPFMITTKPLLADIEEHVFKKLDKIFKKS